MKNAMAPMPSRPLKIDLVTKTNVFFLNQCLLTAAVTPTAIPTVAPVLIPELLTEVALGSI